MLTRYIVALCAVFRDRILSVKAPTSSSKLLLICWLLSGKKNPCLKHISRDKSLKSQNGSLVLDLSCVTEKQVVPVFVE